MLTGAFLEDNEGVDIRVDAFIDRIKRVRGLPGSTDWMTACKPQAALPSKADVRRWIVDEPSLERSSTLSEHVTGMTHAYIVVNIETPRA